MTPPAAVSVRPRRASDLDACARALGEIHRRDGYPERWPEDAAGWLSPAGCVGAWVATRAERVVGHVVLRRAESTRGGGRIAAAVDVDVSALAMVGRLLVVPEARRCGVGRALLDAAVAEAHRLGRRPALDADARAGAAIALYRQAGWQRVGSVVEEYGRGASLALELLLGPAAATGAAGRR